MEPLVIHDPFKDEPALAIAALERLRRLVGVSTMMLAYIVRNVSMSNNPIGLWVHHLLQVDVKDHKSDKSNETFNRNGLQAVAKKDLGKVASDYNTLWNFSRGRFHTAEEWALSWRRQAAAMDLLISYFEGITPDAIFYLVHLYQSKTTDHVRDVWQTTYSDVMLRVIGGLCHWVLGRVMGYLNEDSPSPGLSPDVISQTPSLWKSSPFSSPGLNQRRASRMLHLFFSVQFDLALLRHGKGILPFEPCAEAHIYSFYERWQRDQDGKAVEAAFARACTNFEVSVNEARREIRLAQYYWVRHFTNPQETHTGRGYGSVEIIWRRITQYLDSKSMVALDKRAINVSKEQEPVVAKLRYDEDMIVSPQELDRAFPDIPLAKVIQTAYKLPRRGK